MIPGDDADPPQMRHIRDNRTITSDARLAEILKNPGFGRHFSDYAVLAHFLDMKGWSPPGLAFRKPLEIDPAAAVLHEGSRISEELMACKGADGVIRLFRPEDHAKRFTSSAERLSMPPFDDRQFVRAVEMLVRQDSKWVPDDGGLQLRALMFPTSMSWGNRRETSYTFCVIASPVGSRSKGEGKPVCSWFPEGGRTSEGRTGSVECDNGKAVDMSARKEANDFEKALSHGPMSIFFVKNDGSLILPELGVDSPSVSRDSILTLARDMGMTTAEKKYSLAQIGAEVKSGEVVEAFVCSIAADVVALRRIAFREGVLTVGSGEMGETTGKLRNRLLEMQRGEVEDEHGWVHEVTLPGRGQRLSDATSPVD